MHSINGWHISGARYHAGAGDGFRVQGGCARDGKAVAMTTLQRRFSLAAMTVSLSPPEIVTAAVDAGYQDETASRCFPDGRQKSSPIFFLCLSLHFANKWRKR